MVDCTKYKKWVTIGHLHIPDLILKLNVFDISSSYELLSLRERKG